MQGEKPSLLNNIRIIRTRPEHLAAIADLALKTGLSFWSTEDYLLETRRDDSIFLVAESTLNDVRGFIVGRIVPDSAHAEQNSAEIYNMAVERIFRQKGIGSLLLSDFFRACNELAVRRVVLEVRRRNTEAQKFYSANGFEAVGVRKGFYADPHDDAIIMSSMV